MERLGLGDIVFFYSAVIADQDGIEIAFSYCMREGGGSEGAREKAASVKNGRMEEEGIWPLNSSSTTPNPNKSS